MLYVHLYIMHLWLVGENTVYEKRKSVFNNLPSLTWLCTGASSSPLDGASRFFDTPVMVGGVPHLPFQLQTEYTGIDGSKLVRVVTKLKPVTQQRETAEKG